VALPATVIRLPSGDTAMCDTAMAGAPRRSPGASGAVLANAMFELPVVPWSTTVRAGGAQLLSEGVATFGLLGVVIAVGRTHAAILSLLLIRVTCRTHPAHPVQSAEAAPGACRSLSTQCNPVLGPSRRSRIANKSTIDYRVSTP
jgi:hypothetical protein